MRKKVPASGTIPTHPARVLFVGKRRDRNNFRAAACGYKAEWPMGLWPHAAGKECSGSEHCLPELRVAWVIIQRLEKCIRR